MKDIGVGENLRFEVEDLELGAWLKSIAFRVLLSWWYRVYGLGFRVLGFGGNLASRGSIARCTQMEYPVYVALIALPSEIASKLSRSIAEHAD